MEITDEKIFKVALITTLIGLIGMIIFAGNIEPKNVTVEDIDRGMIDEEVAITGVIENVKQSSSGKSYFLTLFDGTGRITIMVFESTMVEFKESGVDIKSFENKKVKIIGTVTEFKSQMGIILPNSNSIQIEK
ncbi:MAG: OB-fold nucleic acid binding domain-containing protein [Methanobrevibacter sp.]|nr:OB-fold nucleic acid binding domain-containing protein [Methanobrevibacter sp.]